MLGLIKKGFISAILLGSLALVATNSNEKPEPRNATDSIKVTLSAIFPSQNVPQTPKDDMIVTNKNSPRPSESQLRPPEQDSTESTSLVNSRTLNPTKENHIGKFYSYQVPLNEIKDNFGTQPGNAIQESPVGSANGPTLSFQNVDLGDNIHEDFQYSVNTKPDKKPVKRLKDKFKNKQAKQGTQEASASSYGNGTQQIQGAGSGFLHVAHPQENHILLQSHEQGHDQHQFNELNQQIEISPESEHLHPVVPHPQHHVVYNEQHDHGQHVTGGDQLHVLPLPHPDEHAHVIHEHQLPKPLRPSIVHRDPNDFYDHHDKIRTLDKDHENQHDHHHHQEGHSDDTSYPKDYHSAQKVHRFQPYDYDMKIVPECAYKNKHFYNLTFCLEDHSYPLETILWSLYQYGQFAHKLISDVTYQSADNLVTGLTRSEEEGYTYNHYYGASHAQHTNLDQYKPPYNGYTYKTDYFKKGGYICPSDIYYGRPRRAMNTYGQWKVIVNVDHVPPPQDHFHGHGIHKKRGSYFPQKGHEIPQKGYTQTIRMEQCIYPNAPCSYIDPHFHSKCIQKNNFVRLVAWTLEDGLHVDTFKLPISCSCHIKQPIHFFQKTGHHHEERLGTVIPPVNNYLHE